MTAYLDDMLALAKEAYQNAYSPYSGFSVACCVRSKAGNLFAGCNLENVVNPLSQCAEGSALGAMVTAEGHQSITAVLLYADSQQACLPCGGCRQQLQEFVGEDVTIYSAGPKGIRETHLLSELLPLAFTRHSLEK